MEENERWSAELDRIEARQKEIIADAEAMDLDIRRDRHGRFLGVIENAPRPTEIIRSEFGTIGNLVYMELSALSHGGVSSLLSRMTPVAARTGSTLMSPGHEAGQLPILATVLSFFAAANGRRIKLFGWDAEHWNAWRRWAAPSLRQLVHGPPGASG